MNRPPTGAGHRRALSNLGGQADREGDERIADLLATAFEQAADPEAGRQHVHGFHSYPARLHPALARRLVTELCPPAGAVLDPFCGSGTVLVEARLAGRRALGVDLNPLAVQLANLKVQGRSEPHLGALVARARAIAALADDRRKKRAGATHRFPPEDTSAFAPHVLLELDSLRLGIDESGDALRPDLGLILSSLLTKLSLRAGDSAGYQVEKRIAAGYPAKLFVKRTEEMMRQLDEFARLLPPGAPPARALEGDARSLPSLGSFDLILTSPPYPGNYDYLDHHALRLRWLRLDERPLAEGEVGARRHLEASEQAERQWLLQLREVLRSLARQLTPDGRAVMILADSVVGRRPFYNDDLLRQAAAEEGFRLVARASQSRPHFHLPSSRAFVERPRREHVLCLAPPRQALASPPVVRPSAAPSHAAPARRSQPARTRRRG